MINNMSISLHAYNLLEYYECGGNIDNYLAAYKCPAGKWTIGMGCTYYADGSAVKEGDYTTHKQAIELFYDIIHTYEKIVNTYVLNPLTQPQFDALVCFVYNVGKGAFSSSTLLRKVNANPNDKSIDQEFMKWVYVTNPETNKKQVSKGLVNRRNAECDLYFSA